MQPFNSILTLANEGFIPSFHLSLSNQSLVAVYNTISSIANTKCTNATVTTTCADDLSTLTIRDAARHLNNANCEFTIHVNGTRVCESKPSKFAQLFNDITPETRFVFGYDQPYTFEQLVELNIKFTLSSIHRFSTNELLQVDWNQLNDCIQWVALNECNEVIAYEQKPHPTYGSFSYCDGINISRLLANPPVQVPKGLDLKFSLCKRPEATPPSFNKDVIDYACSVPVWESEWDND